jgi:cell division protein FtsW (lipid II flippase)
MEKSRQRIDVPVAILVVAASLMGVLAIGSSLLRQGAQAGELFPWSEIKTHLLGVIAGLTAMFVLAWLPSRFHRRAAFLGLIGAAILLALVLAPGIGHTSRGATRWIAIGGFTFQPSELAKTAAIVFLAAALTRRRPIPKPRRGEGLLQRLPVYLEHGFPILAVLAMAVIVAVQPDLDTAAMLGLFAIFLPIAAGVRMKWVAAIVLVIAIGAGAGIAQKGYRLDRITAHRQAASGGELSTVDKDKRHQVEAALRAMANGGLLGVGPGAGTYKNSIPERENDFISATIGEETGLLGSWGILIVLAGLSLRLLHLARRAPLYGRLILTGTALWIGLQSAANLMMATDLIWTMGIPLPFFSKGGTSAIAIGIALGLAFSARSDDWEESLDRAAMKRAELKDARRPQALRPKRRRAEARRPRRPASASKARSRHAPDPHRRRNGGARVSRHRDRARRP